jgi:hypothetical protein
LGGEQKDEGKESKVKEADAGRGQQDEEQSKAGGGGQNDEGNEESKDEVLIISKYVQHIQTIVRCGKGWIETGGGRLAGEWA